MIQDAIWVQKLDLDLRINFPGLKTIIGQPEKHKYMIHCLTHTEYFNKVKNYIEEHRMASMWITSTTAPIARNEQIIPSLNTHDISNNLKGNLITKSDILSYLSNKFQNIEFLDVDSHPGTDFYLIIYVSKNITDTEIQTVQQDLIAAGVGTDDIRIVYRSKEASPDNPPKTNSYRIYNSLHLKAAANLPFIKRDNDYWHDNVIQIFDGTIKKEDLPYYKKEKTKAYFDFTYFDNINLRNSLLLYDEVYIALPIIKNLEKFYHSQNIESNELLNLIEMGHIKVLLRNDISSYDQNLLKDIYACNPNSIIGQRGINTLLSLLLTDLEISHRTHNPQAKKTAEDLLSLGIEANNPEIISTAQLLTWPLRAKTHAMNKFVTYGPASIYDLGVGDIFSLRTDNAELKENIRFEFAVNSLSPCIAASLAATYFPFIHDGKYTDITVSNGMSDLFKFYRHDLKTFKKIKDGFPIGGEYELRLLQVTNNVSIVKFAELAKKENAPKLLNNLLKKLMTLDHAQQKQVIKDYNNILMDFTTSLRKDSISKTDSVLCIASMLPFFPPAITMFFSLLGLTRTLKVLKNDTYFQKLKNILDNYENANTVVTPEDIQILERMSIAVRLKETCP